MDITITIPDDKLDEVVEALCDIEFIEATPQRAKEALMNWIKGKVLQKRTKDREKLNVDDLTIS